MNIYQKLIEVRKVVPYLKKDNNGYQFQYVSSSQTLGTVTEKMNEVGLLLVPSVKNKTVSDHTTKKGDHEYFTELDMQYTWINAEKPEEQIICDWYGQGLDSGEKGVGKALTYSEKYFLLKFFNIATDKDDPDSFQKKVDNGKPVLKVKSTHWEKKFEEAKIKTLAAVKKWRADNGTQIRETIENEKEGKKLKLYLDDYEKEYAPKKEKPTDIPQEVNRDIVEGWLNWINEYKNFTLEVYNKSYATSLEPKLATFSEDHRNELIIKNSDMVKLLTAKELA